MDAPVLIALGTFTAAIITALAWYILKSKGFSPRSPNRLNLTVLLLFFLTIAATMSFLLFNALVHGEAYGIGGRDRGEAHSIAEEPALYWMLVVIYYCAAVAALSFGLVVAAKLIQPKRAG